jgi:hypothetical protein
VSQCAKLHVAGWTWVFSHAFSGEVNDFDSVGLEYFVYTVVQHNVILTRQAAVPEPLTVLHNSLVPYALPGTLLQV